MAELTLGQKRVRVTFNPNAHNSVGNVVDEIKQRTAALIDLCEELKAIEPRLASIAQTEFESAAMWAVKAATTQPEHK